MQLYKRQFDYSSLQNQKQFPASVFILIKDHLKCLENQIYSIELLSSSGSSIIIKGLSKQSQKPVVLKFSNTINASEDEVYKLQKYFSVLKGISHKGIITINSLQFVKQNGLNRLAVLNQEFYGTTLKSFLQQYSQKTMGLAQQYSLIIQILDAVAKIHDQNIVHCDINTDNILIDFGKIKLFNFSSSEKQKKSISLIPPEVQNKPSPHYSTECDIYALGFVLLEIINTPYAFKNGFANLQKFPENAFQNCERLLVNKARQMINKEASNRGKAVDFLIDLCSLEQQRVLKGEFENVTSVCFQPEKNDLLMYSSYKMNKQKTETDEVLQNNYQQSVFFKSITEEKQKANIQVYLGAFLKYLVIFLLVLGTTFGMLYYYYYVYQPLEQKRNIIKQEYYTFRSEKGISEDQLDLIYSQLHLQIGKVKRIKIVFKGKTVTNDPLTNSFAQLFQTISNIKQLKELQVCFLKDNKLTDIDLEGLNSLILQKNTFLKKFVFKMPQNTLLTEGYIIQQTSLLSQINLKFLGLTYGKSGNNFKQNYSVLKGNENCQERCVDEVGNSIQKMSQLKFLRINFANNEYFDDGFLEKISLLLKNGTIKGVFLNFAKNNSFSEKKIGLLLKEMDNIQKVGLVLKQNSLFSDKTISFFPQTNHISLFQLDLQQNNIVGDPTIKKIASLIQNASFITNISLNFSQNQLFSSNAFSQISNSLINVHQCKQFYLNFQSNNNFKANDWDKMVQNVRKMHELEYIYLNFQNNELFLENSIVSLAGGFENMINMRRMYLNFQWNKSFGKNDLLDLASVLQKMSCLEFLHLDFMNNEDFEDEGLEELYFFLEKAEKIKYFYGNFSKNQKFSSEIKKKVMRKASKIKQFYVNFKDLSNSN